MPTLCPFTRDQPGYWRHRPADHGPDGLYREGPRERRSSLARLMANAQAAATTPSASAPLHELRQARRRALARQATPAPLLAEHPRRCKKLVRCVGVRRG